MCGYVGYFSLWRVIVDASGNPFNPVVRQAKNWQNGQRLGGTILTGGKTSLGDEDWGMGTEDWGLGIGD